jgi:hypothetical protein
LKLLGLVLLLHASGWDLQVAAIALKERRMPVKTEARSMNVLPDRNTRKICEKPAPDLYARPIRTMVATGVQHARADAGAKVCYRSLQWSQNKHPSQLTIQTKSSTAQ